MSTLSLEPLQLAAAGFASAVTKQEPLATSITGSTSSSENTASFSITGLERLLQAVQSIGSTPAPVASDAPAEMTVTGSTPEDRPVPSSEAFVDAPTSSSVENSSTPPKTAQSQLAPPDDAISSGVDPVQGSALAQGTAAPQTTASCRAEVIGFSDEISLANLAPGGASPTAGEGSQWSQFTEFPGGSAVDGVSAPDSSVHALTSPFADFANDVSALPRAAKQVDAPAPLQGSANSAYRPPLPVAQGTFDLSPTDAVQRFVGGANLDCLVARPSDAVLLQRFIYYGEDAAFAALVRRYDRLVLRVCERVLGDPHAAQDACQSTFMVLARKASVLSWQSPLGGWLARVAYRLALRLREVAARRRRSEWQAALDSSAENTSDCAREIDKQEMLEALSEELQRLPEKYRTPLVLCYFQGRTHEEAARAVGLPRGSMAKRIGEGLERLRDRLIARGLIF
jgi:RNA polymerase sigma factor (sigma-70 family)